MADLLLIISRDKIIEMILRRRYSLYPPVIVCHNP